MVDTIPHSHTAAERLDRTVTANTSETGDLADWISPSPTRAAAVPSPAVEPRFLPVEIVAEAKAPVSAPVAENHIEIELAGGHRMRISGSYDPEALARLIRGVTA